MNTTNMNQGLGFRTFILYIVKGILPGFILMFLAFVVLSAKNWIVGSFLTSGYTNADGINRIVLFVIGGLYILSIIILIIGLLVNLLTYAGCRFSLDDYGFKLHRGIISRNEVSIPYHQIQDVNVDQTILGRLLGVGKLIILTAGNEEKLQNGEESEIVFQMIDIPIAKFLQKELIEKSAVQLVKKA